MPSLVIQDGGASIIRAVRPEEFAPQAPGKLLAIGRGVYAFLPDPLPPRLEWSLRLIALLDEARGALGELAGLLRQLPNPYLFIRPFIQKEAVLSSRIEGTQAGLLDVYALEAQVPLFPSPKIRAAAPAVLLAPAVGTPRAVTLSGRVLKHAPSEGSSTVSKNLRLLTSSNWDELAWGARVVDYLWHITLPITASVLGAFAVTTMLTKNAFLEEIRKQYVITARAKGLSERRVLYKHVMRNALIPLVTGFPAAFIGAFFTGSLLIETLFSLDGLGLLSYESVVKRDYPVVLGTLYLFTLIGLVTKLISDLCYVWVDPRVKFD